MKKTVLSVRINLAIKDRLAKLAGSMKRSQSSLGAEATEEYVEAQEWQIAGIEKAIAAADRGEVVPHEDVGDWIASLGTDTELPVPKS